MNTTGISRPQTGKATCLAAAGLAVALQLSAPQPALAQDEPNISLNVGVLDTAEYGYGWGTYTNKGGLVALFESTGEDLTFTVTGYDIDSNTEVMVLLNGQQVGHMSPGIDNGLNAGDTFPLTAQAQLPGLNEIQFVTIKPNRRWGATDLLLSANGTTPPPPPPTPTPGPGTGGSIIDTALANMAPNTWQKININQFQDAWTPSELRAANVSPSQNISGWSGAAWDSRRDHFYIWGGNIGMEEGNEVYTFNAVNGMWERGSLPSAIPDGYGVSDRPYVIGGAFDAPLSGESWDNVTYLENMDRLAIIGITRNSNGWKNDSGELTGPYFWDPSKADPNKVGGSDGTGVDPTTPGGNMWENRDTQATGRKSHGSSLAINDNGTDVVLFSDSRANLWRYTIDKFDSAADTWKLLAQRPPSGQNPNGGSAYDPNRQIFVRSAHKANMLLFWDLNRESEGVFKGQTVLLDPSLGLNLKFAEFGMDYDPLLDKLVLWGGQDSIYHIDFEDLISIDETNLLNIRGFFQVDEIVPAGMDTPYNTAIEKFTGVYGKWQYMEDKNAYIGVIDPIAGDIYVYKSDASTGPPPTTPPPAGGSADIVLIPWEMDVNEYGFGWGSGTHRGGLIAWFESTGDTLLLDATGYDIDSTTEVKVLLNDQELGYLSPGTDNGFNGGDTFILEAAAQRAGLNEIRFETIKPNRKWGVTNLMLTQ